MVVEQVLTLASPQVRQVLFFFKTYDSLHSVQVVALVQVLQLSEQSLQPMVPVFPCGIAR